MQSTGKSSLHRTSRRSSFSKRDIGSTINLSLQDKSGCKMSHTKRCKLKPRSVKTIGALLSKRRASEFSCNGNKNNSSNRKQVRRALLKVSNDSSSKQQSSVRFPGRKSSPLNHKTNGRNANGDGRFHRIRKRRKLKKKENSKQDEASRLKGRTRYLLIKMKLEQNLIDAYSGEGWKGQSREKIKPEKELQRAKKQIMKCKLGIRDAIHQLDLLSSEGRIGDAVISPDGSVFHEHIFCAKCKLRDAFPDNDIILCDGTCNRAFHQKCLEPPLATENIPPGDQGWICKFCECKMEILELINAHLGTCFSLNSNWQDVFKEEATAPDDGKISLDPAEEWPSDDSKDDDYDPETNEKTCSRSGIAESMSDDACSSSGLFWSSDEASSLSGSRRYDKVKVAGSPINIYSDDTNNLEVTSHRRQRRDVDYKKLHDEMFGKDAPESELSEDDDWGPGRRKRRRKESDPGTNMATCDGKDGCLKGELTMVVEKKLPSISQDKKRLFRIPPNAVEKLRRAFAENELPSRAFKENLSKQLGIASEKVSKWFKNARYMALKIRKEEKAKQPCSKDMIKGSNAEIGTNRNADQAAAKTDPNLVASEAGVHISKNTKRLCRRKKPKSITLPLKNRGKRSAGSLPTNTIEVSMWLNNRMRRKRLSSLKCRKTSEKMTSDPKTKSTNHINESRDKEQLYLVELERLFHLEDKVEKLKRVLEACRNDNHASSNETNRGEQLVIYVPVAEVREKVT